MDLGNFGIELKSIKYAGFLYICNSAVCKGSKHTCLHMYCLASNHMWTCVYMWNTHGRHNFFLKWDTLSFEDHNIPECDNLRRTHYVPDRPTVLTPPGWWLEDTRMAGLHPHDARPWPDHWSQHTASSPASPVLVWSHESTELGHNDRSLRRTSSCEMGTGYNLLEL